MNSKGNRVSGKSLTEPQSSSLEELTTPGSITEFLNKNPAFLAQYVAENHSLETIEGWLDKKIEFDSTKRPVIEVAYKYNMDLHCNKQAFFQGMIDTIKSHPKLEQVLWELGLCISTTIGVDGFNVYTLSQKEDRFMNVVVGSSVPHQTNQPVSSVSVPKRSLPFIGEAVTKGRPMCMEKKKTDSKAKPSIISSDNDANFAIYLPITTPAEETVAVLEMWRMNTKFSDRDEDIAWSYSVWGTVALHYVHLYTEMTKQRKLQSYLLHVAHSIFEDMGSMEVLIEKIMHYAQELVDADRASLFLVDNKTKELYATVFDVGSGGNNSNIQSSSKQEIRFPIGTGIAGHVAKTGQSLNISDAYNDDRFNRSVDLKTGYQTKSILCMPVYIRNTIIGVVQMVNKQGDSFNKSDVESFKMFATYCGLALHHAKLYNKIKRSEQKYKVAIEVLSYHNTCNEEEVVKIKSDDNPLTLFLDDFYLNPFVIEENEKVRHAVRMFENLFETSLFDKGSLIRFILTVKKNYRKVPYHNWTHGFSVANTMYNILKRDDGIFTRNERLALLAGSLCHDLDHRGKNNKFMLDTESPLAAMYSTSTMEHHHFNQTVVILQQDGHNIFSQLGDTELKQVLGILKNCILATDLAKFFVNRDKLQDLMQTHQFHWDIREHRTLVMAMCMTAADLSAAAKPWPVQAETVKVIFQEFYEQGDADRAAGREALPMMDRLRPEEQASSQVGFLKCICISCYSLLEQLVPKTRTLHDMCKWNLQRWLQIDCKVRKYVEDGDKTNKDIRGYLDQLIIDIEESSPL